MSNQSNIENTRKQLETVLDSYIEQYAAYAIHGAPIAFNSVREQAFGELEALIASERIKAASEERRVILDFLHSQKKKTKAKRGYQQAMANASHNLAVFDITWDFEKNLEEFKATLTQEKNNG